MNNAVSIVVPAKYLAVIKLFAARKEKGTPVERTGVLLEVGPKEARLVATNNYLLGCFRVEHEKEVSDPIAAILPAEAFVVAPQKRKAESIVQITIEGRQYTTFYRGEYKSGALIDGQFPNYRRIIPATVSKEPAHYSFKLLAVLEKAATILHGPEGWRFAAVMPNGDMPGLVSLGDPNFVGVVAPMKLGNVTLWTETPEWVKQKV